MIAARPLHRDGLARENPALPGRLTAGPTVATHMVERGDEGARPIPHEVQARTTRTSRLSANSSWCHRYLGRRGSTGCACHHTRQLYGMGGPAILGPWVTVKIDYEPQSRMRKRSDRPQRRLLEVFTLQYVRASRPRSSPPGALGLLPRGDCPLVAHDAVIVDNSDGLRAAGGTRLHSPGAVPEVSCVVLSPAE